ncbi:hypothetical protein MUY21_13100 [Aliiroseovarius sp. S2029]|nr:hypothetical protein [Aliiroseovarius sp. S2029]
MLLGLSGWHDLSGRQKTAGYENTRRLTVIFGTFHRHPVVLAPTKSPLSYHKKRHSESAAVRQVVFSLVPQGISQLTVGQIPT